MKLSTVILILIALVTLACAQRPSKPSSEAQLNDNLKQAFAEHVKVRGELAEAYTAATKQLKEVVNTLEKPNATQIPGFEQKMIEVGKSLEALALVAEQDELITVGLLDAQARIIRHLRSGNVPVEEIKSRLARLAEPTKKKDEVAEDKLALAQMSFLVELDRLAVIEAQLRPRRK